MNIVVYAAPATEPLSVAEVIRHCRLDQANVEPAPGIVTAALAGAGAGNVDNGAHRYRVTFVTADGETQGGTVSAAVTVADKTANGKVSLSGIQVGGALVTSRKLYRTAAGGSEYMLLATIADNATTTYTDNTADASLGAGAPTTNTTSDPQLSLLIASARHAAEEELHRKLITQTLDAYLDEWPCEDILLPPLQSVTSITYVDTDGATQTLAADQYAVDSKSAPARISRAYNVTWPLTRCQNNAITIRFIAGYGVASAIPPKVKSWMLIHIKTLLDNPAAIITGANGLVEMPSRFIDNLLDGERVYGRMFA